MGKFLFKVVDLSSKESLEIEKFKKNFSKEGLIKLGDGAGSAQVWRFNDGHLVFKEYSIKRAKQRWRSRYKIPCPKYGHRYGWSEKINAEKIKSLGFLVPELRFYYEESSLFFCSKQVVVFEYLSGFMTLHEQVKQSIDWSSLLELIEPLIFDLAVAGIFHMDLNSKNIMIKDENLKLIDFEYVCWDRTDKGCLYAYYFGYLYQKWLCQYISFDEYKSWFYSKLNNRISFFNDDLIKVKGFFNIGGSEELSRSKRFKLFI